MRPRFSPTPRPGRFRWTAVINESAGARDPVLHRRGPGDDRHELVHPIAHVRERRRERDGAGTRPRHARQLPAHAGRSGDSGLPRGRDGGRSFINGVSPGKMAAQILDDMSCLYLAELRPERVSSRTRRCRVSVTVKRPKVKAIVRAGVSSSKATRRASRVASCPRSHRPMRSPPPTPASTSASYRSTTTTENSGRAFRSR